MSQPLPPDRIDALLSGFYKSKLPSPWPAAPAFAEPAKPRLAAPSSRARYTLAASVAFLLGTCWYLSNGNPSADRPASKPAPEASGILDEGSAKMPKEFEKAKKKELPTGPMLN